MDVLFKLHRENDWVTAKPISKSDKCFGKYANEWKMKPGD